MDILLCFHVEFTVSEIRNIYFNYFGFNISILDIEMRNDSSDREKKRNTKDEEKVDNKRKRNYKVDSNR